MAANLVLFVLFYIPTVICTVDLNVQHLQFVADHLETDECKKLVTALHEKTFELQRTLNTSEEPDKPCLALLLTWDRTEGYGKTFNDLELRLGQIGRGDVADRLSKSLYEEEAQQLEKLFLSDPFKKKVPKDTFLLDEKKKKTKKTKKEDKRLDGWQTTCIVLGAITGTIILCYVIHYIFGEVIKRSFRQFAPPFLVMWVDMLFAEGRFVCRKLKRQYMKEVVGRNQQTLPRDQVMEMNRNLNNYLNGHWQDAAYYFEEFINS